MHLKYTLGALCAFPFLPLMYFQGKRIKASVPKLGEATGTQGTCRADGHHGRPLQLITLGESTIAGVGVETHAEGFSGTLAQHLAQALDAGINWSVYARSGYTAEKVARKLVPKITETQIDLIVIGLGGNDAFALHSPRKWRLGIEQVLGALHAKYPETPIVFINMPPIKDFPAFTPLIKATIGNLVEILGVELQSIVKEHKGVYYTSGVIRLQEWIDRLALPMEATDFFSDGVHPSKFTYQIWAKEVAKEIEKTGIVRRKL